MNTSQEKRGKQKDTIVRLHSRSLLMIIGAFTMLFASTVVEARTVICQSYDRQTQYCKADTRGGVRLIKQLSKSGCFEGQTWGYDRRGIWVSRGCRGKFETIDFRSEYDRGDRYDHGRSHRDDYRYDRDQYRDEYRDERRNTFNQRRAPQAITCQSIDNRQNYCRAPLRHAHVQLVNRLSGTPCRYGENWGWNDGGIWVNGGCRAVFAIEYYGR